MTLVADLIAEAPPRPLREARTRPSSPSGPPRKPRMRASDADRLATIDVLQDAVGRGLLTPDEGGDRIAEAFAAVYADELPLLTADLPPAPAEHPAPGWRALGTLTVAQVRSTLSDRGTGRLRPTRVAIAAVIALLLLLLIGGGIADLLFGGDGGGGGGGFGGDHHHHDHWDWD